MKKMVPFILLVMYTVLIVLATSEVFYYQDSLSAQTHVVQGFLTLLALVVTGLGYVTYRFGMQVLTWVMIVLAIALGAYATVLHVNEVKVLNHVETEMNQQVYDLQQANDPKKNNKD